MFMDETKQIMIAVREQQEVQGAKLDSLIVNFAGLEGRVVHLEQDVAELKSDVAVLKSDLGVLKSDVTELKSDVSSIKTTLEKMSHYMEESDRRQQYQHELLSAIAEKILIHDYEIKRLRPIK